MKEYTVEVRDRTDKVVEKLTIRRLPRIKYKDFSILQQQLMEAFVEHNGAVGSILMEEANWDLIQKVASMLPVVGEEELGFDVSKIEDDLTTITRLFFTQTMDEDGNFDVAEGFRPSVLSEMHQLDYSANLGKAVRALEERRLKAEKEKTQELVEMEMEKKPSLRTSRKSRVRAT